MKKEMDYMIAEGQKVLSSLTETKQKGNLPRKAKENLWVYMFQMLGIDIRRLP